MSHYSMPYLPKAEPQTVTLVEVALALLTRFLF